MASGVYSNYLLQLQQKAVNLLTDTLKYALFTSAYTPNLDSDTLYSLINANEVTGTGYSAGGLAISSPALTQVAANSWAGVWAATTAYSVGQIVRPSVGNGFLYMCVAAGTSGGSTPTFGTVQGETTADGASLVWLNIGSVGIKYTIAAPTWANSTITARYGVLYDTTANASGLLVALDDFGSNISSTNGSFTVTPDANSGLLVAARIQ